MTTQTDPLRIAYVGNFQPEHSTENHVAETLRRMGHEVVPLQENDPTTWQLETLPTRFSTGPDLVLWTRTASLSPPDDVALQLLDLLQRVGVPSVGFHLDRWWGLAREHQVHESPFFRCALVCTADGGHDQQWQQAGVEHMWLPPAVAEFEMGWGHRDPLLASHIAFVGSWNGYHDEWPWRQRLVRTMANRYGETFRCWPEPGQHAIRGNRLRNLYASVDVVVGDSCLAGGATHYWSDRIPETLGRGGLLIHPDVEGLWPQFTDEHLVVVEPENVVAMFEAVDRVLAWPVERRYEMRRAAMAHVAAHHTYHRRMVQLLDELATRGMIRGGAR